MVTFYDIFCRLTAQKLKDFLIPTKCALHNLNAMDFPCDDNSLYSLFLDVTSKPELLSVY